MLTHFFRGNQQAGINVQKGKSKEEGTSKSVEEIVEEIFNNLEAEADEEEVQERGPEQNIELNTVSFENVAAEVMMPPAENIEITTANLPNVDIPEKRGVEEGRSLEPGNRELEEEISRKEKGKGKKRSRGSSSSKRKWKKLRIPEGGKNFCR